ncbi:uncharacterized protein [Panulirus ornatus]|uniref:uncharacterized protein isoform X17 n=1 Tax=Panulirus ornatus TaxID=150431 RepID=UPI003A87475E
MRIITRRRVKVRVTVKRGDGSVTSHGWAYHRNREDDGHERKHDEGVTDEGVTPAESRSPTGEPPPSPEPAYYDSVCNDKNVHVELEEDADYEHPKDPVYESVDKGSEGIYEEVGRKGLRVRFEGDCEADEDLDEDEDMDGSVYSTGAIPKRGNTPASLGEEEEEEEEGRDYDEVKSDLDQEDDEEFYEPIGEVGQAPESEVPPTGREKKRSTMREESETCICDYDEPRKIEVTVTSKREGNKHEEEGVHNEKEKSKSWKRGKVEVKFSPWQTEGRGKKTRATDCKCDGNFRVDQRTELSYGDEGRQKRRVDHSRGGDSPYEVHHRSNIEVSAESVGSDRENRSDDYDEVYEQTESKDSFRGPGRRVADDRDDEDGFGDDENDTYQRSRPRLKKKTLIRVSGLGLDKELGLDADRGLVKTVSKMVVTFGRDSGGNSERTRHGQSTEQSVSDQDRTEDSGTSVIILETYGASPNLLKAEQEEDSTDSGAEASGDSISASNDSSSLNLSGVSDYSTNPDSNDSDDGNHTDHSSQTDTSTETLVCDVSQYDTDLTKTKEKCTEYDLATGALIEYPNEDSEDENLIRSPTFDDLSSIGENGDSLFYNFEEELERVERQYPNLQAEDLLIEEEVEEEEEQAAHFSYPQWTCETAKEGSRCFTITEEGEEEEAVAVQRREKLETTMGQYYSSASGGGISRDDMSGSLPSSPRSSEEWRMSMASTATVASTGTADSDDTVAKDMSELSSINSRLSYLDEAQDGAKNAPVTPPAADTLKATSQLDQKRQTSIKDAIDELESIEQAAQTLLQKRQYSTEDERGKPVSGSETMTIQSSTSVIVTTVTLGEKLSPQSKRKLPPSPTLQRHPTDDQNEAQLENSEKEKLEKRDKFSTETSAEKEDQSQKTEALAPPENLVIDGDSGAKLTKEDEVSDGKSEVKPPLPPVAGSQPTKADVKRRCWSRSREMQPYISRESYNDDRVLKELERLRRSYQESDLNDFLDALEHTTISDDLEEAFLRQLLADISEDVESIQEQNESSTQPEEEIVVVTTESSTNVPNDVPADSQQSSPAASKFEKVKERILEKITVHTAGRVIETGSPDSTTTPKEDIKQMNDSAKDDLGLPGTPQNCRPVTPQSLRPDTPDSKSSRPHTPDVTKGEDSKKGFNIADFLKKGSPKYLRKKYKERKNRKSDLTTTSESESEDPDNNKKDQNGTPLRKDTSTESHSSLKGSNRSLTSSQEVKKEVRFDLEDGGEKKDAEKSDIKDTGTDSATPVAVEMSTKEHRISGPQLITCEAQQQETVIPREFEETTEDMESDFLIMLPSTVEDINNRAESLLPRLPGRPRPPRKKKKLIPASVEEMSGDLSDNSTSTVTSDGSVKMVEPKAEDVKINPTAKEESPPPLPAYEEVSELAETTPKCVEVVARSRQESKTEEVREEPVEVSVTSEDATAVKTLPCLTVFTSAVTPDTSLASSTTVTSAVPPSPPAVTIVTSSSVAATDVTELTVKDLDVPDSFVTPPAPASTPTTPTATDVSTAPPDREVLVAPLPMTSIVSISVAPGPETATLVMYPPRSLPLPVIQESLHEDQVSLPTPNEPRVSLSSHSGSAPITPQDEEEKVPSLYDNVNPFKEMLELESKLLQDIAPESPTAVSSSVEIQSETIREEAAVQESETPKDHLKTDHFDFPQVACKSPDLEKTEIVDIDALAALTTEMFRFTQDMDMGVPKEKKPLVDSKTSISRIDTVVYTPTSSSGPQSPTDGIVCEPMKTIQHRETVVSMTDSPKPQEVRKNAEMKEIVTQTEPDTPFQSVSVKDIATSNTVAVQTDSTRYVRMYDTASQTDTEYETDLETESEMEENGTGKYDASKWLFRPTRQSKIPLPATKDPQMQELHKQHQVMVQELQQQTARQQRRQKEKPEVPPRQFQEKMPLRVVDELKAVLSESEDAPLKLKKVADPPPRRDSKFSWDNGVWSPGRSGGDEKDASGPSRIDLPDLPSFKDQPSVWSPGRAGSASPSLGRKEYRKITYEGTSTPQRRPSQENVTAPPPEESFAWKDNAVDKVARSPTSTLPKVQNPTVTLLQKKRDDPHSTSEGQIPGKRPEYLKPDDTGPKYKPDDKLYVIKREYESEDEEGGRRFAVLGPKKVLGVGPTTTDGVPTTLKSGVKSEHQGEWYRRMFDSLHKVKDDDHIIIKYKVPRARYGGYMSEPEGYDSDVCSSRYATLDRRRQHHYEMDPMTSSLPRDCDVDLDPYSGHTNRYVHQPGRIEDYVPGYSSLSEKELKKNPDADIKLESQSQEPPPVSVNHRLGSQKMSITHALKESGYESDSTLVFRKREDARRQVPDPRKTSQVYRQIQRGGDIPLTGLQKPNPPKPRDGYYVVYSDLDLGLHHPSLSDLSPSCDVPRAMSPPAKPPVPTFGDKKRTAPSKVVLAPSPPRRISSKWHPSLIKSSKDRPPVPSPRSTSAERVRETRALYSSWHREKVARSREKLGTSPARTTSLGRTLSAAKQTQEVRENFLKGRRTVSESRFTIEDREKSPPRRTASPTKVGSPTRQSETREKLHHRSSHREGLCEKTLVNKHEAQEHTPVSARGHNRSLSADSSRKWSNTSAESGRYSVMRHTVSSMNKIKRPSLQQNQTDAINSAPRSSSAESSCRRRRSGCVSPEPQTTSRKSPVGRKDSRCRGSPYSDVSMEVSDDKKLKQSESFDTTQSNETGYSSMLDLSPSPTPEKKSPEDRDRRTRRRSEPQPRPHSAPARRTRVSSSFHEQRNKWEALTRGEPIGGRQSRNPSRSTSPLRSLQLVRQVSSSFKDIPVEVWSAGARRSKSLDVLTPSPHSHPHRYRQYIMELRNAAPRNARISQLRRLFTSLDRVHRLERSVSSVELSAAQSRAFEIIDFETWKGLRERERKALEYNVLLKELNVAQKEREFLYKVTPEKKWTGDCRLRGRDVSVPELCEKFTTATDNSSEITQKRRRELESSKDTYRGLWRGSSVRDLSQMYQSPERHRSSRRGSSLSLPREDSSMRARGLWTSLSLEQVNAFRDHLTEIYGSMQSIRSWRERKLMSSERSQTRSHRELSKYNVDVAETGRALADKLRTLHVRPPAEVQRSPVRQPSPTRNTKRSSNFTQVEDERRQLSKQLSIELQEKVLEQRSGRSLEATPGVSDSLQVPDVPLSISPESLSRSSPRTCYSLDISDSSEPNSLNSGDQFLLLVQKPGRSGRSHSLPPEPVSDPETSDSEVSVRTVVHKDVAGKVKFFEKRARRNSRSSERHSSRGSRLNVDEVPHYATLPSRLKQQSQSKLLSPNYLPERSVSSVNLTSKADVASQAWQIYDKANPLSGSSVQRLHDPPREKKDPGDPTSHSRSYLYHVKTGEVSRLKTRYESPEDARRRAKSLPDVNGPLSRVTPTGRTFVRGQEAGDVQYIRAKYETPRRSRSPDRWQPNRDEYLPKSKLTSTLQTLAARSPAFHEPDTIERLARRDSIEKAVLRRVYTGNVEASVERLENKKLETGSGLSIIGQMYTSAPSVNELAIMAPLIPPRPPPPLMGPQKPQRMARGNPQPLLTSTPTPSPGDIRAAHRERALHVPVPVCPPPVMVHPPPGSSATFSSRSSAHYNADAHRPKSRYIPPESYGTSPPKSCGYGHRPSWTQSLERPHRVTRAMTHSTTPPASQQGGSHCYTLRHHHVSRSHHQPPTKGSPADRHTYSQPYSYTHTSSQPTRLHQSHSHHHSHSPGRDQSYSSKAVSWKEPVIGPLPYPFQTGSQQAPPARPESPYKYESGEVNIHYRTPVRLEQKEAIPEEELARRQEEHMKKVYENERRKKYLAELEDIERRRHTDNFTPLQKSPIPLNRYDDDSSLGTMRGTRTPDLKQVAKALYNFTAQNKRELTFNKGDVVFIRRQVDKNWYEGESRGSVGIFPCNYVEIVPYESIKTLTRKPTEGQARARFNFQAQTSMEMSLSKGELVVLTRRVDENWYEGRIGNRKGIFPVSYVDTLVEPGSDRPMTPSSSPMPRPALPAANLLYNGASSYSSPYSTLGRPESQNDSRPYTQSLTVNTQQEPVAYRALYNYKPQNDDELELLESDIVMVMEKCDDGWFVGTSRRTGLFGTFPGNYVERV